MRAKNKDNSATKFLKILCLGIQLEAIIVFALQVSRAFVLNVIAESAALVLMMAAWLIMFCATFQARKKGKHLLKAWIGAVVGVAATFLECALAGKNVYAGMGTDAFVDIYVMFFAYIAIVAEIYLVKKFFDIITPDEMLNKTWWLITILILFTQVAVPMMMVFPKMVTWTGTVILALLGLITKLYAAAIVRDGRTPANASFGAAVKGLLTLGSSAKGKN